MGASVIDDLRAGFEEPFCALGADAPRDRATVVISWPSVPVEIVRAAGFPPVVARGSAAPTPAADAHLEPDLFPSRLRQLVEAALTGRLAACGSASCCRARRIPTTSAFSICVSSCAAASRPRSRPSCCSICCSSDGADVRAYDAATHARAARRAAREPRAGSRRPHDLRREIARRQSARARRPDASMRCAPSAPRVTGAERIAAARRILAARAGALRRACRAPRRTRSPARPTARRPARPARRRACGSTGAARGDRSRTAPSSWRRSARGAAAPRQTTCAVRRRPGCRARRHSTDAESIGARTTRRRCCAGSTERMLDDVDAVVVSLPPDDAVFGWDYPALRELLAARRIPHVCASRRPSIGR